VLVHRHGRRDGPDKGPNHRITKVTGPNRPVANRRDQATRVDESAQVAVGSSERLPRSELANMLTTVVPQRNDGKNRCRPTPPTVL